MRRYVTRILRNARAWQAGLALYWLALLIGTHLPADAPLVPGSGVDKLIHIAAFSVLAVLLAATWQFSAGQLIGRHLRMAWLAIAVYAALDEWTQSLVGRYASAADWLADAVGALAGLLLFAWCRRRRAPSPISTDLPDEPRPRPNPRAGIRFSLKAMFIVTAVVAAVCYWLLLPSINAQRFAAAIRSGDYAAAERLFARGEEAFPGSWKEHEYFDANVSMRPISRRELLHGERQISVGIAYGDAHGRATCAGQFRATRSGLEVVMFVP
jgi:VanZ family protein